MAERAAIKGTAIRALVHDVRTGLRDGTIPQTQADRVLLQADRELLQNEVSDIFWYDIESFARLAELLRATRGLGDPRFTHGRGAAAAERLISLGAHQQLDFLRQIGRPEDAAVADQNIELAATLWNDFFNFGRWATDRDATTGDVYIDVRDSDAMPAIAWDAIEGFIGRLVVEVARDGITLRRADGEGGVTRFVFHVQQP